MQDSTQELLEVVDEAGNVLRLERRDVIHRDGLLHRDVLVWFWNDKGEILFERRALSKGTNPGMLACSVGGHQNPRESSLDAAVREVKEETGLSAQPKELVFVARGIVYHLDTNGTISNHYRDNFAFHWNGDIAELTPNPEETDSWEWWAYNTMVTMSEEKRTQIFGLTILHPNTQDVLAKVHALSCSS